MPSKKPFLSFVVEKDLLEKIDDYRFRNRFETRSSAIKHLIKTALEHYDSVNNKRNDQ